MARGWERNYGAVPQIIRSFYNNKHKGASPRGQQTWEIRAGSPGRAMPCWESGSLLALKSSRNCGDCLLLQPARPPGLDSIRGRRGDRDGAASKITEKQSGRPTVPYPDPVSSRPSGSSRAPAGPRPRPRRAQGEGDRNTQSCRVHVEIACLPPSLSLLPQCIRAPHSQATLLPYDTTTKTTIPHCTQTHLLLAGTAATAAARFSRLRSIPPHWHWHSRMEEGGFHFHSHSHPHYYSFYPHSHSRPTVLVDPPLRLTCQPPWGRAICRAKLRLACGSPSDHHQLGPAGSSSSRRRP